MTTNINAIAKILSQQNIVYEWIQEKSTVCIFAKLKRISQQVISVRVIGNGDILVISAPGLFQVDDKVFKGIFTQKLLELQGQLSLLKFYHYTLETGAEWVGVYLELPLFGVSLSSDRFFAAISFLTTEIDLFLPRLQHILATGNEPPQQSQLERLIDEMSPDAIDKLTSLLEQRKQGK